MSKSKGILDSLKKGRASFDIFRHGRAAGVAFLALLPPVPGIAAEISQNKSSLPSLSTYEHRASMAEKELNKLSSHFKRSPISLAVGAEKEAGTTPFARMDFGNNSCTVHLNGMDVLVTYFYSHMDRDVVSNIPDVDEKLRYMIVAHEAGHCADMMAKQDNEYLRSIALAMGVSIENKMASYDAPPEIKKRVINGVAKLYGETFADIYAALSLLEYYRERNEPEGEALELIAEFAAVRHLYGHVDEEHNSSFALKNIDAKAVPFDANKYVMQHIDQLVSAVVKSANSGHQSAARSGFGIYASASSELGLRATDAADSLKPTEKAGFSLEPTKDH